MPWVHNIDARVSAGYKLSKDSTLLLSLDIFNIFNFQQAVAVDQRYTQDSVLPIGNGEATVADLPNLKNVDNTPFDPTHKNPNFGRPIAYQAPRSIRIGAKVTF